MKKKVYCDDCKYYHNYGKWGDGCLNKNIATKMKVYRREYFSYPKPEDQNKNNDCVGFTPSLWLRFKRFLGVK